MGRHFSIKIKPLYVISGSYALITSLYWLFIFIQSNFLPLDFFRYWSNMPLLTGKMVLILFTLVTVFPVLKILIVPSLYRGTSAGPPLAMFFFFLETLFNSIFLILHSRSASSISIQLERETLYQFTPDMGIVLMIITGLNGACLVALYLFQPEKPA